MTQRGLELKERFELYVSPEPNSGCWLWTGFGVKYGYGCFAINSQPVRAHRLAHQLYKGPIPRGLHVLHKCDIRACVNPDHLFLGTNADNVADKVKKGRQARDRSMGKVKFAPETILAIRADSGSQWELSRKYGVSRSQIARIRKGQAWRHLQST